MASIAQAVRILDGTQTISDMFNVFEGLANGHADDSIAQSIVDTLKHEVGKRNHSTTDAGSSDQEIMSEKPKVTEVEAVDSMLSQSGVVAMHDRNNVPTGWASCMLVKGAHQVVKDVIGEAWCSKVCKAQDKIGDKWCADHQDVVMQDKVTMERTMKTPSAPMHNTKIRDDHRSIYARPNALNKVNAKPQDKEDEVTFGECMCNKIMTFMMMIPKLLMLPIAMVLFMLDQVGGLDKCIKNGPKVCLTIILMFFVARGVLGCDDIKVNSGVGDESRKQVNYEMSIERCYGVDTMVMDTHDYSSPHNANKSVLEKHVNELEALEGMKDDNQDVEVHMCTTLRQVKTLQDMHGNTNVVAHSSQDGWVALVDSGCTGLSFKDKTKFVELDIDASVRPKSESGQWPMHLL